MERTVLVLSLLLLLLPSCSERRVGEEGVDVLARLDQAIEHQDEYDQLKETAIENLLDLSRWVDSPGQLFRIYIDIADKYAKYDTALSLQYAVRALEAAHSAGDHSSITSAVMTLAWVNSLAGFQVEALELMAGIERGELSAGAFGQYYHVYRTIYGSLGGSYQSQANKYRDSMKLTLAPGDISLLFVTTEEMIERGEYTRALELLAEEYGKEEDSAPRRAILAYSMGMAHMGLGDGEWAKYYLAESSINDIRSSLREYKSLQSLAFMLFEEGDIERAYTYINKAIDDALKANVNINMPFISRVIPVITRAYEGRMKEKERQRSRLLLFISVLSLGLVVTVLIISGQMRKARVARRRESTTNQQLSTANGELLEMNGRLRQSNLSLRESNNIKETYVARYMDLCSDYIGGVERYRSMLSKIARTEGAKEVIKELSSKAWMEEELREFYENFDATFLHLFPDFVQQFNALLKPAERVVLKPGRLLNPQLRIFALIRLGITDSVKIAEFLRYSVNTIYNYRVKMRNAALDERDDFEGQVGKIGRYD